MSLAIFGTSGGMSPHRKSLTSTALIVPLPHWQPDLRYFWISDTTIQYTILTGLMIVHPDSTCGSSYTCTIFGWFSDRTRDRHLSLCLCQLLQLTPSHHEFVFGESTRRSPVSGVLNISNADCLINRVLSSPVSLKMWPNHCRRLALIQLTMLKVLHFDEVSWCGVLSEITLPDHPCVHSTLHLG